MAEIRSAIYNKGAEYCWALIISKSFLDLTEMLTDLIQYVLQLKNIAILSCNSVCVIMT